MGEKRITGYKKRLSITNDLVFKAVFGKDNDGCKMILIDLLNAILDLEGEKRIKSITYKNPFNVQETSLEKLTIMDIKIETEDSKFIDIEMQVNPSKYYKKRSLYYWANLYMDNIGEGESYKQLKKCIVINIMNCKVIESHNYHTVYKVLERDEHTILTDDFEIHFLEIPEFNDEKPVEEMTEIEKWMTFFKDVDKEEKREIINQIANKKEAIKMADEYLKTVNEDELVRERLRTIEMYRKDQATREEEARDEGREVGREEGILIVAKNLLDVMDDETIAGKTGLSVDEVRRLREQSC